MPTVYQALIIGFLLFVNDSLACSCNHVGILKNKREVDYVFKGKISDITEVIAMDTITSTNIPVEYRMTYYTFDIIANYKGADGNKTIQVVEGMTDCEVKFEKEKVYIVYAYTDNAKLHYRLTDQKIALYITTHLCTRTKRRNVLTFWETFVLWLT